MIKTNINTYFIKIIKITFLIIFSNLIQTIINSDSKIRLLTNSDEFNITDAIYYANEICSYNQDKFKFNKENNTIACTCEEGYLTYNPENKIKFGDHPIQCNYEKKRGYIVFFFSLFALLGIEHFYLERYFFFVIIFILYLGTIILECRFVIVLNLNTKEKEKEREREKEKEKKSKNEEKLLKTLPFVCLTVWIVNLIFVVTEQYKDGNDQPIFWDIKEFLGF
jgi:hypothetical protein